MEKFLDGYERIEVIPKVLKSERNWEPGREMSTHEARAFWLEREVASLKGSLEKLSDGNQFQRSEYWSKGFQPPTGQRDATATGPGVASIGISDLCQQARADALSTGIADHCQQARAGALSTGIADHRQQARAGAMSMGASDLHQQARAGFASTDEHLPEGRASALSMGSHPVYPGLGVSHHDRAPGTGVGVNGPLDTDPRDDCHVSWSWCGGWWIWRWNGPDLWSMDGRKFGRQVGTSRPSGDIQSTAVWRLVAPQHSGDEGSVSGCRLVVGINVEGVQVLLRSMEEFYTTSKDPDPSKAA